MTVPAPLRNVSGDVVPHDNPEIADTDGVIRRVSEQWITPGRGGSPRLSSIALSTSSGSDGGMSVDLERPIVEAGIDPRVHVTSPKHIASIRFDAGVLRGEELMVGSEPLPDNPFHGEVWGKITPGKFKRLIRKAAWFVPLDGVKLADT